MIALGAGPGIAYADLAGGGGTRVFWWTEAQAESITSIRGMRVRVRACHGFGRGRRAGATDLRRRFNCLAGARIAGQRVDTVAVTYVLHPRGPYRGRSSRHALTTVRFGGLGVP